MKAGSDVLARGFPTEVLTIALMEPALSLELMCELLMSSDPLAEQHVSADASVRGRERGRDLVDVLPQPQRGGRDGDVHRSDGVRDLHVVKGLGRLPDLVFFLDGMNGRDHGLLDLGPLNQSKYEN